MPGPSRLTSVEGSARALFDVPVAVAATEKSADHPAPFAAEAAHVVRAVPARQAEFAAGRAAIRAAMAMLGMPAAPVINGQDRAPIWPAGCIGSLTHSRTLCLAALARADTARSIGVDLEDDSPLDPALIRTICTPSERSMIAGPEVNALAKLIFCAKEAAYKAQYPITGKLFDFQTLEVTLNLAAGRFVATFGEAIGPFTVGDTLPGRYARIAGHLVTGVTILHGTRGRV